MPMMDIGHLNEFRKFQINEGAVYIVVEKAD